MITLSRSRHLRSHPHRTHPHHGQRRCGVFALLTLAALTPISAAHAAEPVGAKRGAVATVSAPMSVLWKFSTGYFPNNPASPAIAGDTAYVAAGNRLYAVDLKSGAQKWRYPSDSTLTTFIFATPVVSDGTVFFSAGDGLYALNAADGKQKWPRFNVKGGAITTPIVKDGTLYFGAANGKLYALEAATGTPRTGAWSPGGRPGIEVGDIASDTAFFEDTLYFITSDQALRAFSLAVGAVRWAQRLDVANGRTATPVATADSLYVSAGSLMVCLRRSNGQVRFATPLPNEASAPPVVDADGNAYVVTTDRSMYALDGRGRSLWKQVVQTPYEVIAQPLLVDGLILAGTTQGGVCALDMTSGATRWSYIIQPSSANPNAIPSSTNIASRPIVADGTLYVLSDDGALTAFRQDAPDTLAPTVTRLEPEQGEYLSGRPPFRISAKIQDEGSGINEGTLSLKLDDKAIPRRPSDRDSTEKPGFKFTPETGMVEYTIFDVQEAGKLELADGFHTATLSVKDWKGNTLTKAWVFYIDDTLPRKSRRQPNQPGGPNGPSGPGGTSGPGGKGGGGGGN